LSGLATVIGMLGILGIGILCGSLFCRFIVFGWIRSMYLTVVVDTAAGSEDLPSIRIEDGLWEDVFKPAFRYIGAYACALLPTALYLIASSLGIVPNKLQTSV